MAKNDKRELSRANLVTIFGLMKSRLDEAGGGMELEDVEDATEYEDVW